MKEPAHFEKAHRIWIASHLRATERRRRPAWAKRYAQGASAFVKDVWWPLAGSFDFLLPQVAATDFAGHLRIIDLAYMRPPFRIGFVFAAADRPPAAPHRPLSDFWIEFRFSRQDVEQDLAECRRLVASALERLYPAGGGASSAAAALSPEEKEIIRLAARSPRPITPVDVAAALRVCDKTARTALKSLVDKRLLRTAGGGTKRIRSYAPALAPQRLLHMLG